jgi:hypothetical protein
MGIENVVKKTRGHISEASEKRWNAKCVAASMISKHSV